MTTRESICLIALLMSIGGLTFFSGKQASCPIQRPDWNQTTAQPGTEALDFRVERDSRLRSIDSQLWSDDVSLMAEGSVEN